MCQVQILSVNGIIPPGQTTPTHVRVAGRVSACPSGQVVLTLTCGTPPTTIASPPVSPAYGMFGDGFIYVFDVTGQNVACGDANNPVSLVAECYQRSACRDTYNGPLQCCDVVISYFDALVAPGSLTPNQIRVTGTSHGCAGSPPFIVNDPVIVKITFSSGASAQSGPVPADPLTGAYFVQIPIPAATLVRCDDKVAVDAWCSTNPNCKAPTLANRLDCPQCARAIVSVVNFGTCTGTPPKQPVTVGATINVAGGTVRYFRWVYGDGSMSPVFQVDNTSGTSTTPYTVPPYPPPVSPNPPVTPSHDYSPGNYTTELIVTDAQGNPLECDRIPIQLAATCDQCANVSVSATPGACVNSKRRFTLNATVNSLPAGPTAFQWLFGDTQQGLAKVATAPGAWPSPPDPSVNEHDYAPGTYTATLTNILAPGCPPATVTFTVDSCPLACCPSVTIDRPQVMHGQLQPEVTGCAPGSAVATFNALLNWPAGCTPVAATSFEWTLSGPGGKKYQKSTSTSSTDTTAGWKDAGGNPAMVQFSGGASNYSVSVTAIIPGVSLPCNPTDTAAFTVPACCPQLIGPLNASQKPGDCCTWLFSAQVLNPNNAPVTLEWSFQDGATASTLLPQLEHTYAASANQTGDTILTLKSPGCPDQQLTATVTHCCVPCPAGQHRDASGNCVPDVPPACPPGQSRDSSGNCVPDRVTSTGCDVLLWISLVLILLSGMGAVGGCVMSMWLPYVAAIVGYIALALLIIGLVLFFIWWVFCRRLTACPIILGAIAFMRALIAVFFLIGVVLGLIALGGWNPQWLMCVAVSWIQSAIWGMLLSILYGVAIEVGCLTENPGGGPIPPSSSASGLASSEIARTRFTQAAPAVESPAPRHLLPVPWVAASRIIGLGDVLERATSAVGIPSCKPCHERAERLNRWASVVGTGAPSGRRGDSSSGGVATS